MLKIKQTFVYCDLISRHFYKINICIFMFNLTTIILYQLLIVCCFIVAFLKRKENKFPIYIYFLFVAIIEIYCYFNKQNSFPYQFGSLFYAAFFTFYYAHFTPKLKKLIYMVGGFSFAIILYYFLQFDSNFPSEMGITAALLFISFSLIWFYEQIKRPGENFIIHNETFWISAANLLWGIIFLFRVSMMYWLAAKDLAFLIILDKIFKISLLLTYVFLLIGVTKKQYSAHERLA